MKEFNLHKNNTKWNEANRKVAKIQDISVWWNVSERAGDLHADKKKQLRAQFETVQIPVCFSGILLKCSAIGIGFNGAETNCGIARILGILLMNSCDT